MNFKDFEIIDFHMHPFYKSEENICAYADLCDMSVENTLKMYNNLGVTTFCGSVLDIHGTYESEWAKVVACNESALKLRDIYKGAYVPGFHVHPAYIEESIKEIERMDKLGIKLMGEICPYLFSWSDYSCPEFSILLDEAEKHNMIVSFHSDGADAMDNMVKEHPGVIFVAAHPGEYGSFMRHLERAKMSENYYIDLSGYGMFRHGMVRKAIDSMGVDRILFGSDFTTCNPAMYVGGVLLDELITDTEKEKIFSLNAKRLLGL